MMFDEATQNEHKISYDEYYKDKRLISDMIVEVDIGSAQPVSSPKYLICAPQTRLRLEFPNKNIKIAIFDKRYLRK